IANTAGVLDESVADHTFGLLLAASRRVCEGDRMIRAGAWSGWALDQLLGRDLRGATLGLVGFGGIAQAVARRARGFDMRVLYTARHRHPAAQEERLGVTYRPFADLLRESDLVSLHVPLTAETRHLLGPSELALLKPTAIVVNTSRGPVLDESALVEALGAGRLWAAGLDVFEHEPAVPAALVQSERVVLTPHVGSGTIQTRSGMCVAAVRNVLAVLEGRSPPNPVNPEVLS
ncbi:MAG: 2-hydroxyacid dehydrogenase, partial [Candidatus Dormibacteraceae bacterium]